VPRSRPTLAFLEPSAGPEPRETIAVADTGSGRILSRITPQQGVVQTMAASADGVHVRMRW
jgi:hypothetical protein